MNIKESFRGALRRLAGARVPDQRRTLALPSILVPYGARTENLPKPTPANLRRFAETPIARKAINTVKDRIAGMKWRIQPKNGRELAELPSGNERVALLADNLDAPNSDDSFRSFAEQVLEDIIVGGFGAVELQLSGDAARPLLLYPVDGATIKMRPDWDGDPRSIRYAQATGKYGPEAYIELADEELSYIRLNPRTHTPFGLGRLEVAFETINAFLGAHRYAARLASNSVVQFALWLQDLTPAHHERLIRWWQDEIEGTGRVPILSAESKPEVLRFGQGTDADLRLNWQEFLLRVIADAFDLPPLFLGLEHDVNRSTADQSNDQAFRSAIVPTARLFAEHLTRDAIHKRVGWDDLEFVF
ncbi:MAG: phage portal protein, partial [Terriglobales bacterium]